MFSFPSFFFFFLNQCLAVKWPSIHHAMTGKTTRDIGVKKIIIVCGLARLSESSFSNLMPRFYSVQLDPRKSMVLIPDTLVFVLLPSCNSCPRSMGLVFFVWGGGGGWSCTLICVFLPLSLSIYVVSFYLSIYLSSSFLYLSL